MVTTVGTAYDHELKRTSAIFKSNLLLRPRVAKASLKSIIGKNLAQARRAAGITQTAAAERLGITNVTISSHERGVTRPSDELMERYAELYHVVLRDLYFGTGEDAGDHVSHDAPRRAYQLERGAARLRMPPKAYELMMSYIARLERKGFDAEQIDTATRLMLDDTFAQLHGRRTQPVTEEEWLVKVKADWKAIEAALKAEGFNP